MVVESRPSPFRHILALAFVTTAAIPAHADRLFASNFGGGWITEVDLLTGATTRFAADPGLGEDGACNPSQSFVYFAQSIDNRMTRWPLAGGPPENVIPAAGAVRLPEGLSFDHDGDLYFNTRGFGGASGAWMLAQGDPAGAAVNVVPTFTQFGEGSVIVLAGPHAGALLLVDALARTVLISEPPGAPASVFIPASSFAPGTSEIIGIATDGNGEIFVVEHSTGTAIVHFDVDGGFLSNLVPAGGPIDFGLYLEFDSAGNLYVADGALGTIWKILPDGTITALATVPGAVGLAMCRDRFIPRRGGPPNCDAGGPVRLSCASSLDAPGFQLDGSASGADDGGPITYSWTTDCPSGSFDDPFAARPFLIVPDAPCDLTCVVYLAVTDLNGEAASCEQTVTVLDDTPPTFTRSGDQFSVKLWPPNHGYVVFDVADVAGATDACGSVTFVATGCSSDQPEDAPERAPRSRNDVNGDGHTVEDCVISLDGSRFAVRAERLGSCGADSARTYGIALTATDECGNAASSQGVVIVEHDRSTRSNVRFGLSLPPNEPPPFAYRHDTVYGSGCAPSRMRRAGR